MTRTKCALCNKDDSKELYSANFNLNKIDERIFSARRLPDKIHYRIVRCKKCGLIYSNPTLPRREIENLYKKSSVTYEEHTENLNKTYGYYLDKVGKYISSKDKLLEIGCGNGFFLEKAKNLGYQEVWGVEPGKKAVAKAPKSIQKNIVADIFRPKQFQANFFDVICLFQTLDHLVDPNETLTESYRILKNNGLIFVIVHDVSSWSAKLLGENSPIIDIEHTYLFDKKTLPLILKKTGFSVIDVFDVVNTHSLRYWLHLFPLPKLIKRITLSAVDILGIGELLVRLRAGNIGLVGRKN